MLTCDICDNEIKRNGATCRIPGKYAIPEIDDVCRKCDRKINIAIDKIKQDSMRVRRFAIRDMIQTLKDSQGTI
ncbi:hypothetical protein KAR91_33550 [Candidatus Pacearchaeota archaeon]|nr:hypothetical protein [Candidatus Pacearchaeota archaeon]